MKIVEDLKSQAVRTETVLKEQGGLITDAVNLNSGVLTLVGLVSVVALALAVVAIKRGNK